MLHNPNYRARGEDVDHDRSHQLKFFSGSTTARYLIPTFRITKSPIRNHHCFFLLRLKLSRDVKLVLFGVEAFEPMAAGAARGNALVDVEDDWSGGVLVTNVGDLTFVVHGSHDGRVLFRASAHFEVQFPWILDAREMAQLFVSFDADGSLQRIGRLDVFGHGDGTGGDAALGGGDAALGGSAAQSRPQNCPTDGCQTKGGHFGNIDSFIDLAI